MRPGSPVRAVRDLPAPPGLPFVGNALQIENGRMHLIAENWRRQYGDYYRFRIGRREMVVVSDPEAIATMLRDRPDGFRRTRRLAAIADEMGFSGVFTANGERWRRQRPMVMAGFDPAHIKSYFPALVKVTRRFAGRWRRAAESGTEIDVQADLMRYTVDVTAGLAFGADINTLESDDDVIQRHLDKVLPALFRRLMSPIEYWKFLPRRADRELQIHLRELRDAVHRFIAEARGRMEADSSLRAHPKNLIEAMIAARDTEGSGVDDADVAGNVLTMLLAGEDTTANTLAWMIWLLSRHPKALARARDEVRSLLGGEPLPANYEQLSQLPYVEACTHETMRLKPVAPIIILEAIADTVVAGIAIPAGQVIICLMRPGATDGKHFADPGAFHPERWLESGAKSAASAKRVAMPFGAGPRLCPGRYLAMHEMKMAIAMLLAGFEIERAYSGTKESEPPEQLAFTMAPVGLKMKLRYRAAKQ